MGDYAIEREGEVARWCYFSPEDEQEHGVFTDNQMQQWFESGYFNESLKVRTVDNESWFYLREYISCCNGTPFNGKLAVLKQYINNQYYDQQRQQQVTPIPLHIPLHPSLIIPPPPNVSAGGGYGMPTSANGGIPPQFYMTPNSSMNNAGNGNFGAAGMQQQQQQMMFPPGMEPFDESSQIYKHDGYGNERENPSSSSLSGTPDSERCLTMMEDMKLSTPTFDKCIGTEDAPWLLKKKLVDNGTTMPCHRTRSFWTQTGRVHISHYKVKDLLKELTGLDYNIY